MEVIECMGPEDLLLEQLSDIETMIAKLRRMHQQAGEADAAADEMQQLLDAALESGVAPDFARRYALVTRFARCAAYHDRMVDAKTAYARAYPYGR